MSIPKEVAGQTQPIPPAQQSVVLEEAERLHQQSVEFHKQGKYTQAIPLAERSLAILEKLLGQEHHIVATSLNNLAELYKAQGKYNKAEKLLKRSLAIRQKVLGTEHPEFAISLNNLAELYKVQGRYDTAEQLFKRSRGILEKALGKEHPHVTTSLNNLVDLYKVQGRYDKAEKLLKRSLAIRQKVLGTEHPEFAISLNNLAELYKVQGRYDTAEQLFKRSRGILEKVLGKEHPHVATSLINLAGLYQAQGIYEKAEPLLKRSLAIREKALGKEHPDVAQSLNNLAGLYQTQGSYEKAEKLFNQSLAILEKVLGKEHPHVASSLNNLGGLYELQGRYENAEELYQQSRAIFEKVLGKEHFKVAQTLNNLALVYQAQGRYEKAEELHQRSLAIREKVLGKEHPDVAQSLNNLAELYRVQGNYKKAEELHQRSLAIREKVLGAYHPHVALSLNNLAALYHAQGDITRAIDFFSRGLEVQEQNLKLIFTGISEQRKQDYIRTFAGTTNGVISLSFEAPNNPKAAQLALTTVLRRKGRVLDAVTDSTQILRSQLKNNPQAKQLFEEWLEVQQQLSALVFKELGKQTPAQYKTRYEQLEARREELEEAINAKSTEFRTEFESVDLAAVQARIPKDAALVEIVQYYPYNPKVNKSSKPRYAAAILRNQGQPKWVDLGETATINKSVSELRIALSNTSKLSKNDAASPRNRGIYIDHADGKSVEELARNLDEQVMKPIRSHLGNTRHLLLSPDGQLTLIPFEALRDEKGKYLIQRYAFSYLTSGRDLLRFDSFISNNSAPVVFADIDYDQKETTVGSVTRGDSRNHRSTDLANLKYEALDATSEEAQQIKSIFTNIKIISKKQATETTLKQLQSPSILHLATHGFFLPDVEVDLPTPDTGLITNKIAKSSQKIQLENPLLRSGLALAGFNNRNQAQANSNDGVLTALEVAGLDLKGTELVVLSACETGLGDVKVGEGLYGLRRALVMAGSQSQILSLWKVSDDGTKDLMVKYYQGLKAGKGRHQALRKAQLELLSTAGYEHPYFWASFLPSGDWRALDMRKGTYHN